MALEIVLKIKYSGSKQTVVELLIYFCKKVRKTGLPLRINTVLGNIYMRQIDRIKKVLLTLHEYLLHYYAEEIKTYSI